MKTNKWNMCTTTWTTCARCTFFNRTLIHSSIEILKRGGNCDGRVRSLHTLFNIHFFQKRNRNIHSCCSRCTSSSGSQFVEQQKKRKEKSKKKQYIAYLFV